MSDERRTTLADRLAAHQSEPEGDPEPVPAPPAAAAPVRVPVPSPAPAPVAENDDGRDRFTFYLDKELGRDVQQKVEDLFYDARGDLSRGDVYTAIVRAGMAQWNEIERALWARIKGTE